MQRFLGVPLITRVPLSFRFRVLRFRSFSVYGVVGFSVGFRGFGFWGLELGGL